MKNVRCNNAVGNKNPQERLKIADWKVKVDFEYTARDTPQQQKLAEVAFTTIGNSACAMMIAENVPYTLRFTLYWEENMCATLLDGLVLKTINCITKTRVEHWSDKLPIWAKSLRTWGEAGVATVKTKTTPKLKNRGITSIFVGYTANHAEGVYWIWNPSTGRVLTSRDVTWSKRMYYRRQPTILEIYAGIEKI